MADSNFDVDKAMNDTSQSKIQNWEWNIKPTDDNGISELVQCRVDPSLSRAMDVLIHECKGQGIPVETRSDFLRLCLFRGVGDVQGHIGSQNSTVINYLALEKQVTQASYKADLIDKSFKNIQAFSKGMNALAQHGEWIEVHNRLTEFLEPVIKMRKSEPFLAKLYIKELLNSVRFQRIFTEMKSNISKLSKIIKDAEKIANTK